MTVTREELYKEFAAKAGHPVDAKYSDIEELKRRFKFLKEEVEEVLDAIYKVEYEALYEGWVRKATAAHLLKELADVQYTLSGFAATFNLPLDEAYKRVHESNLSKFKGGPFYDATGKVTKGPNYEPPILEDIV